ncbi:MAG: sugar transferase [Thermodesulfovibrionales bacterium]
MKFLKKNVAIILLPVLDVLILIFLLYLSFKIRVELFPFFFSDLPVFVHPLKKYLWLIPIYLIVLFYEGAYTKRFTFWDEVKMLWKANLISIIVVLLILFATKQSEAYSRLVIFTWFLLAAIFLPAVRPEIKKFLYKIGIGKVKVLIIGAGENGIRFLRAIKKEPNLGYEIAGFLDDSVNIDEIEGIKIYRFMDSLDRYINNSDVNAIAITIPERQGREISEIISRSHHGLDTVFYVPAIKEIPVTGIEPRYFFKEDIFAFEIKNSLARPLNYFLKRCFDYSISFLLLPFIMPLLLLFSILIKITSQGPVIFSQERIGKNCRVFKCYKFRTMYRDAEERLKEILDSNPQVREEWERTWKLKNDPRVTPVGKFLRKTSLDELPQIFNILKGEMSLVGPRPYLPHEVEKIGERMEICYSVLPGITGLWQVSGRSNTTYEERVALDCWYVRNWSLWLDIVILLKTIKVVIKKEGAY